MQEVQAMEQDWGLPLIPSEDMEANGCWSVPSWKHRRLERTKSWWKRPWLPCVAIRIVLSNPARGLSEIVTREQPALFSVTQFLLQQPLELGGRVPRSLSFPVEISF